MRLINTSLKRSARHSQTFKVTYQIISDLEVLPDTKIYPLRKNIFSVPKMPHLRKYAKYSVTELQPVEKLQESSASTFTTGRRSNVILKVDEGSIDAKESQRSEIFYDFSQEFLTIAVRNCED